MQRTTPVHWLQYGMRQGIRDLRQRWNSETFYGVVAACFLLQGSLLLLVGAYTISHNVQQHAAVHLELRSKATPQEIQDAYATLLNMPSVAHVSYLTQEQAYDREKKEHPELIAFLEEFQLSNPFPETFVVTLQSAEDIGEFIAFVRGERWQRIFDTSSLSSLAGQEEELRDLLRVSHTGLIFAIGFFVLTVFLLICILRILLQSCSKQFSEEARTQILLGSPSLPLFFTMLARIGTVLATALIISGLGGLLLLVFLSSLPEQAATLPSLARSLLFSFSGFILLEVLLSPLVTLCCIWGNFQWPQPTKPQKTPARKIP